MKKTSFSFVLACVLLWPSSAFAAKGFWGWLEEMSGPGPFRGGDVSFTVFCRRAGTGLGSCVPLTDREAGKEPSDQKQSAVSPVRPIVATVDVKFGRFTSDEEDRRFKDLPASDADNFGAVRVIPFSVRYMVRQGPVEVGVGVGFWRVSAASGADFRTFYKLALTPAAVAFNPLKLRKRWKDAEWARFLRVELDTTYVPAGFKGADFNNKRTTFEVQHEFLTRGSVVIDGGALLWRFVR